MADSPLLFFRLRQGKVWHVACAGAHVALCGEEVPERSERQPKRPPYGGRVCPSCASVSAIIELAIVDAERARLAQTVNTTTTTRLYEHDLTDPDGVLSDEEYSARQVVEQARLDAASYREGRVLTVEEVMRHEGLIEAEQDDPLAVAYMQAHVEAFVNGDGVPSTGYEPVDGWDDGRPLPEDVTEEEAGLTEVADAARERVRQQMEAAELAALAEFGRGPTG